MKKILLTISLLITISNIAVARERIKNDPEAHVKPTYSTEIEAVEIVPTVVHMSETEEIVMETTPTTVEETTETTTEETTEETTQVVVPEVEQAFVDSYVYAKSEMPNVGYIRKDVDDASKAEVESIQGVTSLFSLIPISSGVRITYRSDISGWAEFDITYKTIRGEYTNTVIKPIAKGLNILTLSTTQSDAVSYFKSQNVYCSAIRRTVMSE